MKVPRPDDKNHATTPMSSYQKLYCHDCKQFKPWPLSEGQPPLITTNRDTRKSSQ